MSKEFNEWLDSIDMPDSYVNLVLMAFDAGKESITKKAVTKLDLIQVIESPSFTHGNTNDKVAEIIKLFAS